MKILPNSTYFHDIFFKMFPVDCLVFYFIAVGIYGVDGIVQKAGNFIGIVNAHSQESKYAQLGGKLSRIFDCDLFAGL